MAINHSCLTVLLLILVFVAFVFGNAELSNKSITLSGEFGDTCHNDTHCNNLFNLSCNQTDNRCDCADSIKQFPVPPGRRCVWRLGVGMDLFNVQSPFHLRCPPFASPIRLGYVCRNISCQGSNSVICSCNRGHIPTNEGLCEASYTTSCNDDIKCNSDRGLACINQRCDCRSPTSQVFESKVNRCVGMVDTACDTLNTCHSSAVCVNFKCECPPGWSKTSQDTCALNYGAECNSSNTCNFYAGLACIDGKCICFDQTRSEFDEDADVCRAKKNHGSGRFGCGLTLDALEEEELQYQRNSWPFKNYHLERRVLPQNAEYCNVRPSATFGYFALRCPRSMECVESLPGICSCVYNHTIIREQTRLCISSSL